MNYAEIKKNDIANGVCNAIANKAYGLLRRAGMEPDFMMTGGVAKNPGVVRAVERKLGADLYICQEPEILILDEPTTYLDISYQVEVLELVQYLNRKLDLSPREQKIVKKILKASLRRLLREPILEMKQVESKEQQEETAQQMDMFHIAETQLADEISKLDVMAMTPIEALQTLFELQKKAKGL